MARVTKAAVIEAIDEVIEALAKYQDRAGREIELIVRADGTVMLMQGDEWGTCFTETEQFGTMEDLWGHLIFVTDKAEATCTN